MDKKICNISSYNRKSTLLKTIDSIYPYMDVINVALNSYDEIPSELIDDKINLVITDNSKGDAYKFLFLEESDGYYFTIDDDLIYYPHYTQYMIDKVDEYKRSSVITLHGRSFNKFPIESYYKNASEYYRCLGIVHKDVKIQFGGTGVMCFHTDLFKIGIDFFLAPNMADVWIGKYCEENNIPIICAKHDSFFVSQQEITQSIYDTESKDDKIQTEITNEVFTPKDVSIIIPTYKNVQYLNETLESIIESAAQYNFEILVGIDGCKETLDFVQNNDYDNFVKFFYFDENVGTYIVKNTLINYAKAEKIIFFDSDDIMRNEMVPYIVEYLSSYDCVKPMYLNFEKTFDKNLLSQTFITKDWGEGVFGINKNVFLRFNGFEGWRCSADSEFMARLQRNSIKMKWGDSLLFHRRLHNDSLTRRPDTGYMSELRRHYNKLSREKTNFGALDELCVSDARRVYPKVKFELITKLSRRVEIKPNEDYKRSLLAQQALSRIVRTKKIEYHRPPQQKIIEEPIVEKPPITQETVQSVLEQVSTQSVVKRIPMPKEDINKRREILTATQRKTVNKQEREKQTKPQSLTKRNKGFNF